MSWYLYYKYHLSSGHYLIRIHYLNDDSITLFANLVTGDLLSLDASPCAIDADTYQVTLDSYSFATGIATNYAVTASVSGSIVIEPAEATVTTGSKSRVYDGTELTYNEASITGLVGTDTASVTATGTIKNAGSTPNTYSIDWGTTKEGNYTVTDELGTLTVEKVQLNFVIGDLAMDYRGNLPSSMPYVSVTATAGGEGIARSGRQHNVGTDNNVYATVYFYEYPAGDGFALRVEGFSPDAGTHTLTGHFNGSSSFPNTSTRNYNATITNFSVEKVTEDDIPEEVLRLYADNRELLSQACDDAGWDQDKVLERIEQLSGMTGPTIVKDGLTVSVSYAGGLMRELTNARINIDSDITDYNGRALNGEEARFTEGRVY